MNKLPPSPSTSPTGIRIATPPAHASASTTTTATTPTASAAAPKLERPTRPLTAGTVFAEPHYPAPVRFDQAARLQELGFQLLWTREDGVRLFSKNISLVAVDPDGTPQLWKVFKPEIPVDIIQGIGRGESLQIHIARGGLFEVKGNDMLHFRHRNPEFGHYVSAISGSGDFVNGIRLTAWASFVNFFRSSSYRRLVSYSSVEQQLLQAGFQAIEPGYYRLDLGGQEVLALVRNKKLLGIFSPLPQKHYARFWDIDTKVVDYVTSPGFNPKTYSLLVVNNSRVRVGIHARYGSAYFLKTNRELTSEDLGMRPVEVVPGTNDFAVGGGITLQEIASELDYFLEMEKLTHDFTRQGISFRVKAVLYGSPSPFGDRTEESLRIVLTNLNNGKSLAYYKLTLPSIRRMERNGFNAFEEGDTTIPAREEYFFRADPEICLEVMPYLRKNPST